MPLSVMSFQEANQIIKIYADILSNSLKLGRLEKFRYSELKGYDIFDIVNALKIQMAYRVFNVSTFNEVVLEQLKKEASENSVGCMSFFSLFAPDNIVQMLKKLDPNDILSRHEAYKIEGDFLESDLWKSFSKIESQDSFLDYCISVGKEDINYWEKVYSRIGIPWDDRDEYDEINYIILNKNLYFKKSQPIILEEAWLETNEHIAYHEKEKIEETNSQCEPSFYKRHKSVLDRISLILFVSSGLLYSPLRILIFCIFSIVGVIQFYFWIKEPIENKLNFALNIFYIILCLVGIFYKKFGSYILELIIVLWVFDFIRNFKKLANE